LALRAKALKLRHALPGSLFAGGLQRWRIHDELAGPETSFAGGGVHLVVVPVDYIENSPALPNELRDHAAKDGGQS
jgi:hypothetical protein